MYVSGYIHPKWFESEGDRDLYGINVMNHPHPWIGKTCIVRVYHSS